MKISIIPTLLAGGTGTRLWPLSRKSYPKQFSSIFDDKTLFQQTLTRLSSSDHLNFEKPIVLTNSDFRFIVVEQMQQLGSEPDLIIIEPIPKNTAPAILAASIQAFKKDKDAVLLVAPSDHIIPNKSAFHKAISIGLDSVMSGKLVNFGIKPTHAETGYGYLEPKTISFDSAVEVVNFKEKPSKTTAKKYLAEEKYYWNAGIFLFKAGDMIDAFKLYDNQMFFDVENALKNSYRDLNFLRLDPLIWGKCENISIDYDIFEKADNLVAVLFEDNWSDLGDWVSVWRQMKPDEDGVALSSNAHSINCKNTLLRSEAKNQEIVGIGLDNIIAVAMPDAVLIANKDNSQDVKKAVLELKSKNLQQAEQLPKDHRPWGWFESIALSERFQVKKIFVNPGAALSLQSHHHRSEHWIVVEGTAQVTIGEKVSLVGEGESVFVPMGEIHRMENPGKLPMILIEVQTGSYLGEDDIIRYEDLYSRN